MARRLVRYTIAVRGAAGQAILAENAIVQVIDPGTSGVIPWYPTETGGVSSVAPIRSSDTGEVQVWIEDTAPTVVNLSVTADALTKRAGTGDVLAIPAFTEPIDLGSSGSLVAPVDGPDATPSLRTFGHGPGQAAAGEWLQAPTLAGGMGFRKDDLSSWTAKMYAATPTAPVDVLVIGDSIAAMGDATNDPPWPTIFERGINVKAGLSSSVHLPGQVYGSGSGVPVVSSSQGAAVEIGTGGHASRLSNAQVLTHAFVGSAVAVVYRTQPGDGTITWRDGVGGPVLGSTTHGAANKSGRVAVFSGLTDGPHTLHGTAAGNATVEAVKPLRDNHVRVWSCAHSGYNSAHFTSNPDRGLDLLEWLEASGNLGLVIVATGTNDNSSITPQRFPDLVAAVQARTSEDVVLWSPYRSSFFQDAERTAHRSIVYGLGLPVVDADVFNPAFRYTETVDGTHPFSDGKERLAFQWTTEVSGDPIGQLAYQAATAPRIGLGGVDAAPGNILWSVQDYGFAVADDFAYGSNTTAPLGELGWSHTGPGVTEDLVIGAAGHPGVIRVRSGTTAGDTSLISFSGSPALFAGSGGTMAFWFKVSAQNAGIRVRLGAGTASATLAHGMWLEADPGVNPNWQIVSYFFGSETGRAVTSWPVVAGRWIKAEMTRFGNSIAAVFNGQTVGVGATWTAGALEAHVTTVSGTEQHVDLDRVQVAAFGFDRREVPA